MSLRDYQKAAINEMRKILSTEGKVVVQVPCGIGKSAKLSNIEFVPTRSSQKIESQIRALRHAMKKPSSNTFAIDKKIQKLQYELQQTKRYEELSR